ncbi:MAG: hypothetical protein RDV48_15040 [Candidatus Eremiobacteraeota bacterium]|nr:hypothetical protein [Candidatus Eremiobacteraeota bacterium]
MKTKRKCYVVNCPHEPLQRVGVNMLKVLGIQPGSESFEKQKHLIAVEICRDHFLEKFPSYQLFKKSFFQGMIMISKTQYIAMAKELYGMAPGKIDEGDFKASPRS